MTVAVTPGDGGLSGAASQRRPAMLRPRIRARAPLRISFAGGGTDVPPFPSTEGGCVLSATIDRYAYGSLAPRTDRKVTIESVDFKTTTEMSLDSEILYDGMTIVTLTGAGGGKVSEVADICIRVPSDDTARIQEACLHLGHTICEMVKAALFPRPF